jgi:peptidase A4-like protein
MNISPGDTITASVQYFSSGPHANNYVLYMINESTNQSFTIYFPPSYYNASGNIVYPSASDVQWLVEAPGTFTPYIVEKLPYFGTISFFNCSTVIGGITLPINTSAVLKSGYVTSPYNYINDTKVSELIDSGTGFSVTYGR